MQTNILFGLSLQHIFVIFCDLDMQMHSHSNKELLKKNNFVYVWLHDVTSQLSRNDKWEDSSSYMAWMMLLLIVGKKWFREKNLN